MAKVTNLDIPCSHLMVKSLSVLTSFLPWNQEQTTSLPLTFASRCTFAPTSTVYEKMEKVSKTNQSMKSEIA